MEDFNNKVVEEIFGINFKDRVLHAVFKNREEALTYLAYIKTYLYNLSSIPNIIKIVDSIIESRALNSFDGAALYGSKGTLSDIEKMIDMTERKKHLLIIRNTMKTMLSVLDELDRKLIFYKYVKQEQTQHVSRRFNVSVRNLYRKYNRMLYKMTEGLIKNGFTIRDFEKEVECEDWLKYYFKQIYEKQLMDENRKYRIRCVKKLN